MENKNQIFSKLNNETKNITYLGTHWVNFKNVSVLKFEYLKTETFLAIQEPLKLTCTYISKRFHFIMTMKKIKMLILVVVNVVY